MLEAESISVSRTSRDACLTGTLTTKWIAVPLSPASIHRPDLGTPQVEPFPFSVRPWHRDNVQGDPPGPQEESTNMPGKRVRDLPLGLQTCLVGPLAALVAGSAWWIKWVKRGQEATSNKGHRY